MGTNRLFHHLDMSTFAGTSCRLPETALISIYCLPMDPAILPNVENSMVVSPPRPLTPSLLLPSSSFKEKAVLGGTFCSRWIEWSFDASNSAYDLLLKKKNNERAVPDYHIWNTFKVSAQDPVKAILGPLEHCCSREHEIVALKFCLVRFSSARANSI